MIPFTLAAVQVALPSIPPETWFALAGLIAGVLLKYIHGMPVVQAFLGLLATAAPSQPAPQQAATGGGTLADVRAEVAAVLAELAVLRGRIDPPKPSVLPAAPALPAGG